MHQPDQCLHKIGVVSVNQIPISLGVGDLLRVGQSRFDLGVVGIISQPPGIQVVVRKVLVPLLGVVGGQ